MPGKTHIKNYESVRLLKIKKKKHFCFKSLNNKLNYQGGNNKYES